MALANNGRLPDISGSSTFFDCDTLTMARYATRPLFLWMGIALVVLLADQITKVMVIGAANDIPLYRELIRKGVSEYLTTPLTPVQLIRTIAGLYADPATPFVGRQIAVVGARGGSGSSTLAHNLAWSISERLTFGVSGAAF